MRPCTSTKDTAATYMLYREEKEKREKERELRRARF